MASELARDKFEGAMNAYFKSCTTQGEVVESFDRATELLKFYFVDRYNQIKSERENTHKEEK